MKTLLLFPVVLASLALFLTQDSPRSRAAAVKRGEYLVNAIACDDCHTPWIMGEAGPGPDLTRRFSCHPADLAISEVPAIPGDPWETVVASSMTAWAGPWGVSFTANLTPDEETGIGQWTEEEFVATLRNGRHRGMGRELLPPMPSMAYRNMTDEDLGAVFAYLKSQPAHSNRVPEPLPPGAGF
jgi:mono/diheme cytochrome c family protein